MSTVRELHNQAMQYAHRALVAREQGRPGDAIDYARQAYEYEYAAVQTLVDGPRAEPTRSILYKSAASLAYQARMLAEAERFAILGLSGNPSPRVKEQLYNLLTNIRFHQWTQQKDTVKADAVTISLFGNAVGVGTIWYHEFQSRIASVLEIVERNIQRHSQRSYRRSGAVASKDRPFIPVLEPFREGSVIVTIQLVQSDNGPMPMFASPEQAIDDLITGIQHVNDSDMDALEELIADEDYRQNFVSNAKRIAPDGDKIQLVGISNEAKTVSFTRQSQDIPLDIAQSPEEETTDTQIITVTGVIDEASRKESNIILTDDEKNIHKIRVAEGLDSYVRSFFGYRVTITGVSNGKAIRLQDLQEAEE